MKLKILFRTSGGRAPKKELGFGHIYRSMNLARNLKKCKVIFLVEDYGGAKKVMKKKGFQKIYSLQKNKDVLSDIHTTEKIIKKEKIDILIIDKFKISNKFLRELKRHAKIVLISDLKQIDFSADLVVNGFVGFKNKIKKNKFGSKCLLGPSFQIISHDFKKISRKKPQYDLLATFGGSDENNIIEILLRELYQFKGKIKTKIILGPGTKKTSKLQLYEKKLGNSIHIIRQTDNMLNEISNTNYGLCSGGITSYEFATMKKPFGIICQVKHQLINAKEWEKRKIASNLGLYNKKTGNKISNFLNRIEEKKIGNDLKNVHTNVGNNTQIIAKEILKLKKDF